MYLDEFPDELNCTIQSVDDANETSSMKPESLYDPSVAMTSILFIGYGAISLSAILGEK